MSNTSHKKKKKRTESPRSPPSDMASLATLSPPFHHRFADPPPPLLSPTVRIPSPSSSDSDKPHIGSPPPLNQLLARSNTSDNELNPGKRKRAVLCERNENASSSQAGSLLDSQNSANLEDHSWTKLSNPLGRGSVSKGKTPRIVGSPPLKKKCALKLMIPLKNLDETVGVSELATSKTPSTSKAPSLKETFAVHAYYGIASKKGLKAIMEDTHTVSVDLEGDSKQAFFGVFDGHGGSLAAEYVSAKLLDNINIALADSEIAKGDVEQAVSAGYLITDKEFLSKNVRSGACSVTAFIKDGYAVVANAGDCRAVLSRAGKAEALTNDHRPSREDECKRIERLGGYIVEHRGVNRVMDELAVSRSFGDINLKEYVTAEPEVTSLTITSDCEFLILASDGLWDKVSNQEAVDCARQYMLSRAIASGLTPDSTAGKGEACKKLVEMALKRPGFRDDITVLIVDLRHFCMTED